MKEKKEPQSAKIQYMKIPNKLIKVVGFENFLTLEEIRDQKGADVALAYRENKMFMYRKDVLGEAESICIAGTYANSHLLVGDILTEEEFKTWVNQVKKCGELLHEIVVSFDIPMIKTIIV